MPQTKTLAWAELRVGLMALAAISIFVVVIFVLTGKGGWFRLGDGEVHLTQDDTPQPPSGRHFACEVDGLAELKQKLAAAGRPVEKDEGWRFFTRDPSGNRIELVDAEGAEERSAQSHGDRSGTKG